MPARFTLSVRNPEKEADPGGPCHPLSLKSGPNPHQPSKYSNELKPVTRHDPCALTAPEASLIVYRPPPSAFLLFGFHPPLPERMTLEPSGALAKGDRKSTRLNSSHANISYAVFCLKKKKKTKNINSTKNIYHSG